MARIELTDAYLRKLQVTSRTELTDTKLAGLQVRAYPSGRIVFAFRMRKPGGDVQGCEIGPYPDVSLRDARVEAERLRAELRKGQDVTAAAQRKAKEAADKASAAIPTLREILDEYESGPGARLGIWRPRPKSGRSDARGRIELIFAPLLDVATTDIDGDTLARAMSGYKPASGKSSANGQVAKARAYLAPVFDWCASRDKFKKAGRGRATVIEVADVKDTYDPSEDDDTITGNRDRVLIDNEIQKILPLLTYPASKELRMQTAPESDLRPIALRFLLLTCARRGEVENMVWRDFREAEGNWHKPKVKSTKGGPRQQSLPLSDAAMELLRSLPGYKDRCPDSLVFTNASGGKLDNWDRITKAIQRESGTEGWHRHDLRRTSSTYMRQLGINNQTIDEILGHNAPTGDVRISPALRNYVKSKHKALKHVSDPQKMALDQLADVLAYLEASVDV